MPLAKKWITNTRSKVNMSSDANISNMTISERKLITGVNSSFNFGNVNKLPPIRDNSLFAASHKKNKKEISFIKVHYDFERHTRYAEEVQLRH